MAFLQNIGIRFVEKCGAVEPRERKKSSEPTCLGAAQHSPLSWEDKGSRPMQVPEKTLCHRSLHGLCTQANKA